MRVLILTALLFITSMAQTVNVFAPPPPIPFPSKPLPNHPPILPPIIDPFPPPPCLCGLVTINNTRVPLKQISIEANVYGFFADVSTNLTYVNEGEEPMEVQFIFPTDAKSALYNMTSHCEHTITGEIKEKKEAEVEYQAAIDAGQQASLLTEDDKHSDVLNLKLGNIKPGQTCWVHFAFVNDLELSEEKQELTFTYPIVLGDRYNAHPEKGEEITNVPGRLVPEDVPYTYTFDFNVIDPREVELKATGDLLWEKNEGSGMSLKAGQVLRENFGIVITHKNAHPFQFVEQGSNPGECSDQKWQDGEFTNFLDDTVAMLNLFPDFSDENLVDEGQEYVVILDRSGSMSGDRIKQAKLTLTKFLNNLPTKNGRCRFNILSFGTDHEFMFKESMACTERNIQNAKDEVATFDADMGGTEMLNTFDDLFKQDKLITEGIQRQVFLLTDGEVSNTQEVIDLVKEHKDKNRIFSFGIGEGVSSELVDGVAQFGGASRILKSGEEQDELNKHVLRALKASQSSYYFDLDVGLEMSNENICSRVTSMGTTVFPGEFFEVFVVIRGELPSNGHLGKATLFAKTFSEANENGKRSVIDKKFEFEMRIFEGVDVNSLPIHRVAAKRIISALKLNKENIDWQERDEQMLVVSKASNVLSPVTALIAVDHDAPKVNGTAKKVVVPVMAEESMMDMAVAGGMPAFASYSARNLPIMPMAPMAPMPMPIGGAVSYGGMTGTGGSSTGFRGGAPLPSAGGPPGGSFPKNAPVSTTWKPISTTTTTTTTYLYPPEYHVLYEDKCVQEQYLKSIEAEDVDNCAAKVNIDDECSRFFTFNDKSQDCGCLTNSDDRFKKEDASDCSIYKINPNPWLNKTEGEKSQAPSLHLLIFVLFTGAFVGLGFGTFASNCRSKTLSEEDHYIHLDVSRRV